MLSNLGLTGSLPDWLPDLMDPSSANSYVSYLDLSKNAFSGALLTCGCSKRLTTAQAHCLLASLGLRATRA